MITDTESDLAARGAARIDWIRSRMPLLAAQRAAFAETVRSPGIRIGMSLHLEPKTAVLLETLAAGGAEMVGTGNHGSTQDDVVALPAVPGHDRVRRPRRHDRRTTPATSPPCSTPARASCSTTARDLAAGVVARGAGGPDPRRHRGDHLRRRPAARRTRRAASRSR